ncbi:glutamate-1-semialdehyde 2,1-aminomutase [Francisella noatunensis]|uniref:Glutamate-1-semialdehyde 2,1-aminomutase n=1 Tax=Francisella noatunensis TaxID=657445 RepID=A0A9Q2KS25_9GAMM|nr:glutamate-1-semialdehyde 2,1-aminomutase [Francisella noatunensis]MBK2029070.1 glutamate-1-semialdehyde 2,1-aminomutase [Francisella noatunensis]MBK2034585.1 glutamate-1-semialdehyde 2,1-aminomutase [Francisella noatunensis]MBK2048564.1 glutamate-1-semialdehyde 2,1-aminomutase [Francisella noatunensis]MBK2050019.1 glutamate-1-semialdehyde 2,1-aminomutase [Francisella noatunensis]MBK2051435.1 glutamate-1-semialdehyde 2,1-aminomutase [Francisella noatunensis]
MENKINSQSLFQEALQYIPGGVNSPVRAFKSVGQEFPRFIKSAKGAYLYDIDWNKYIDYIGSWGPMILGHGDDDVLEAIQCQLKNGLSYGAPCKQEVELAKKIIELMPNIEQVRFVNSGTEATMSAIRLARAYTGRNKIIKFEGCYHGHADEFLVAAGSGALSLGQPNSPGVPEDVVKDTLVASFNDIDSIQALFKKYKDEIACIIVEPIAGNMNMIFPQDDFLAKLRSVCDENNSLLIFDEVMTGFRVALGGAQSIYDVKPDLTTLGKVIGGGMPVGAFGGRKEIMQKVSPAGPVYQAGTLSGNPIAMAAGIKTLEKVSQDDFFVKLEAKAKQLVDGLNEAARVYDFNFHAKYLGGMFGLFFCSEKVAVNTFTDLGKTNLKMFNQYFAYMLDNDVYLAPSAYEAGFISIAHSDEDIEKTICLTKKFFQENQS